MGLHGVPSAMRDFSNVVKKSTDDCFYLLCSHEYPLNMMKSDDADRKRQPIYADYTVRVKTMSRDFNLAAFFLSVRVRFCTLVNAVLRGIDSANGVEFSVDIP